MHDTLFIRVFHIAGQVPKTENFSNIIFYVMLPGYILLNEGEGSYAQWETIGCSCCWGHESIRICSSFGRPAGVLRGARSAFAVRARRDTSYLVQVPELRWLIGAKSSAAWMPVDRRLYAAISPCNLLVT